MLLGRIESGGTARGIVESLFGIVSGFRIGCLGVIFLDKPPVNMGGSIEESVTDLFISVTHARPTNRDHLEELAIGKIREALLEFIANFILEQKVGGRRAFGSIGILGLLRGFFPLPLFASIDLFFSVIAVENFGFAFPVYLTDARRDTIDIFRKLLCDLGARPHSLGHRVNPVDQLDNNDEDEVCIVIVESRHLPAFFCSRKNRGRQAFCD